MLTKNITYTDYNGVERTERFFFNLTTAELVEMELGTTGGFTETVKKIIETEDKPTLMKIFKDLVLKSYGEKSADGKRFIKMTDSGVPLSIGFSQSAAYSKLFVELASDDVIAAEFINGVMPAEIANNMSDNNITLVASTPVN